ncbi:MAG: hypothetical protein KDA87_06245 [Planctomycetales bacterium]|nr:hypothetical protein [Planctomycetales bacterium]
MINNPLCIFRVRLLWQCFAAVLLLSWPQVVWSGEPFVIRQFGDVERLVSHHFGQLEGYEPGDIISQGQTDPLFKMMATSGWVISDLDELNSLILKDGDFLIRELNTPKGRAFRKKIGDSPRSLTLLDRMSEMSNGRASVHDMIYKLPDGHKIVDTMMNSKRGERLLNRLSKSNSGGNVQKPTNKLYTVELLKKRLGQSFQRDMQTRQVVHPARSTKNGNSGR